MALLCLFLVSVCQCVSYRISISEKIVGIIHNDNSQK